MVNIHENQCTKFGKAQERHDGCCYGVFITNFSGVGIQDLVEHLQWSFFPIQ